MTWVIWNEITEALCLQKGLLQLLAHEDIYADLHTLIKVYMT